MLGGSLSQGQGVLWGSCCGNLSPHMDDSCEYIHGQPTRSDILFGGWTKGYQIFTAKSTG